MTTKKIESVGRRCTRALVVLLAALACAGCPAMAITKGAEMATGSTLDDRSYQEQAADEETKGAIEEEFLEQDPALAEKINVDVFRGLVMLTGVVPTTSERGTAVSLATSSSGGGVIYDDIQVVSGGGLEEDAEDFVANKELGVKLLESEGASSQSYLHRVVNGVAYILGQASSEEQVRRARETALGISGVRDVVTHVTVSQ